MLARRLSFSAASSAQFIKGHSIHKVFPVGSTSRNYGMAASGSKSADGNADNVAKLAGCDWSCPELRGFMEDMHRLAVDGALTAGTDRAKPVISFRQPEELKASLDLEIGTAPADRKKLVDACSQIAQYSVKTYHPHFFNQLYSGLSGYGVAGSWLTDALNTNIHTYEVSPAFVLLEQYLMQKICGIVGYPDGDGIFCPGGSMVNIMAMNLARYRKCPEFKTHGMYAMKHLKYYTSEEGALPTFVMATSGTTVLGAYDNLADIADVCQELDVWLHCDACWGGGALLSPSLKYLMDGIHRTDSMAWNFHKMSAAPLQCSVLVLKQKGLLEDCNRFRAEYLFQPDKNYNTEYDIGDKTVQCGRKVDALKLWVMWRAIGDAGMAAITDNCFRNARYLAERMAKTDSFRLVIPEFECGNVCFWYIPPSMRGEEETPDWWNQLAKVAPAIKARMMEQGTMMIGYNPLTCKGLVNFFRIIVANPSCTTADMDFVIHEIERLGRDL
ncbi:cysteine sulfinic acid decarboxylase-like isoform X2 [Mya arenaria]|uniref:cysteine sulfinic acid decarboxylase-like isoform X2 n=1 Tax=Mya arenaria TaxID=6604 RepID=UPI0022E65C42|nr:cysteine sulfinic acid decarboxylase-like isoform X2 [Mya arenaria]